MAHLTCPGKWQGKRVLTGSGSSAIACNNLGFEFVGCELDPYYFEAACKRILEHEEKINELIL